MLRHDAQVSDTHVSDQELLLAADGELSTSRRALVQAHLAACWNCRARMAEMEATIADFARAHRENLDPQMPPIDGARALLRAQLSQLSAQSTSGLWQRVSHLATPDRASVLAFAMLLAVIAGGLLIRNSVRGEKRTTAAFSQMSPVPNRSLTPGVARIVSANDVCSMAHEEVVGEVSPLLREKVLREYGIVNAHPGEYEIDYLIAPGLGGEEDIHNLWPESYQSPTWNARVKDALEEHLHEMVCAGQVDLSTAQRDIATDWIAAYKKYFHSDRPLPLSSRVEIEKVPWLPES